MDGTAHITEDVEIAASPSRAPLLQRTNSRSSLSTPTKIVRRKRSFVRKVDSSEELPSPNGSIFEAFYISNTNSDDSSFPPDSEPTAPSKDKSSLSITEGSSVIAQSKHSTPSYAVDDIEFRYGRGTVLETITEQKSSSTMYSLFRPKSADNNCGGHSLGHLNSLFLSPKMRSRQSFSLDDLGMVNEYYHEACASIAARVQKAVPIPAIYAEPKVPLQAPLERPSTPPGVPSWTQSQNSSTRCGTRELSQISSNPNFFRRAFGREHSRTVLAIGNCSNEQGCRSASAPSERRAPTFRPPRSAYGQMEQHPFNNVSVSKIARPSRIIKPKTPTTNEPATSRLVDNKTQKTMQKVRLTPSAAAGRVSTDLNLQSTAMTSNSRILQPLGQFQPLAPMLPIPRHNLATRAERLCPHNKHGEVAPLVMLCPQTPLPTHGGASYIAHPSGADPQLNSISSPLDPDPSLSMATFRNDAFILSPESPSRMGPYQPSSFNSPTMMAMDIDGLGTSRSRSISSTTNLMAGAILPGRATSVDLLSQSPGSEFSPFRTERISRRSDGIEHYCWRCKVTKLAGRIDHLAMKSASCFCFICCGYDCDDSSEDLG
jgi:hypothetical protein